MKAKGYFFIFALTGILLVGVVHAQQPSIPITAENVSQLVPTVLLGRGPVENTVISPDGSHLLIHNSLGVWLYKVETLKSEATLGSQNILYVGFTAESSPIAITSSESVHPSEGDGWSQTLTIIDIITSETLHSVEMTTAEALDFCQTCFAFNADASLVSVVNVADINASELTQIDVLDVQSGEVQRTFEGTPDRYVTDMVLSPSGAWLLTREFDSNGNEFFMLWNTEKGSSARLSGMVWYNVASQNFTPVFSPDERYLAFSNGGTNGVKVYDLQGQFELGRLPVTAEMSGSFSGFNALSFSPDGSRLGGSLTNVGLVWDINAFRIVQERQGVTQVSLLPAQNQVLLVTPDQQISLWDSEADQILANNSEHNAGIETIRLAKLLPDAQIALVYNELQLQRWDLQSGQVVPLIDMPYSSVTFDLSPDGKRFAAAINTDFYLGSIDQLLNAQTFETAKVTTTVFWADPTYGSVLSTIDFNGDGSLFVYDDIGVFQLFKADFLDLIQEYGMADWSIFYDYLPALVLLSPDQQQSLLVTADKSAAICQGMPQSLDLPQTGCEGMVEGIMQVMPSSGGGIVNIYEDQSGTFIGQVDINPVLGDVAPYLPVLNGVLSTDNRLLALIFQDRVVVWDMTSGEVIYELLPVNSEGVIGSGALQMKEAAAFNADASLLVVSEYDYSTHAGVVVLYDMENGTRLVELPGAAVVAGFTADGTQLITLGNIVQSWSPAGEAASEPSEADRDEEPEEVVEDAPLPVAADPDALPQAMISHIPAVGLAYQLSPDGRYLLSRDRQGSVWDATTGTQLYEVELALAGDFSPDSNTLALATMSQIQFFDAFTGEARSALNIEGFIASLSFGDATTVVLSTCDAECRLEFWDIPTATEKSETIIPMQMTFVFSAILSPDGKYAIVIGSDAAGTNWTVIMDAATGELIQSFDRYRVFAFDAEGRILFAENEFLRIYDPLSFTEVDTIPIPQEFRGFSISGDGKHIGFLSGEQTIQILDYAEKSLLTTLEIDEPVHSFELNSTGNHVMVTLQGEDVYEVEVWGPQP